MDAYNMINPETLTRSIACRGNAQRLAKLMERADRGEKLTLAFFGGSITQGSLASTPEGCYAYLTYDWFVRKFPKAHFTYINAGIGGTTSQFGVTRVDDDVLAYRPDFCVLEFSVNDDADEFFRETYEGALRRLWYAESSPAVVILNNLFYESGRNAQDYHNLVGESYDIPCISIRDAIYPEIEAGRIARPDITPDNLHPNDKGHAMLAGFLTAFLDGIYGEYVADGAEAEDPVLPLEPITANAMEHMVRIWNDTACGAGKPAFTIKAEGFEADLSPKADLRDLFKKGWKAGRVGDRIELEFTGSELAVQYRKTIHKPAPVVTAVLDGDEAHPITLDGNFEETWGDSLHIDTILYHGRRRDSAPAAELAEAKTLKAAHRLVLTVTEASEKDVSDFYLVSFMAG